MRCPRFLHLDNGNGPRSRMLMYLQQRTINPTKQRPIMPDTRKTARNCTDVELLTSIIDDHDTAADLIERAGSLDALADADLRKYKDVPGFTPERMERLSSSFEVTHRVHETSAVRDCEDLCSPEAVAQIFGPRMRAHDREVFKVVYLSTRNEIISSTNISEGGLTTCIVEPRAVFKEACLEDAAAIICLHNHPSGNPEPSREDIKITRQLADAGKMMGVPVHDHIIIGDEGRYISLAERGIV